MRTISPALAAHLAGDATTLCHCWRVTRRDGVVLGFTDHDEALDFGGTRYQAASGFQASEMREEKGLAAPASEVTGGFSSEAVTEADLGAGRYDGARVEVFKVNWQAPDGALLLKVQEIGEVSRAAGAFTAELRSFAHRLSQETGRIYNRRCDATLGDRRCGVDLAAPGRRAQAVVTAVSARDRLLVSGLEAFADGHFRLGSLTLAEGTVALVEESRAEEGATALSLWLPLSALPAAGDAVTVSVGCDKAFSTCREKFDNALNFQGFPHMPGSDFAYSYVSGESLHDGAPLFE